MYLWLNRTLLRLNQSENKVDSRKPEKAEKAATEFESLRPDDLLGEAEESQPRQENSKRATKIWPFPFVPLGLVL